MKSITPKLKLKIGDEVVWNSQARGFRKKKQGKVIARIKAGKLPEDSRLSKAAGKARPMFAATTGRTVDSFLVLVERTGKTGEPLRPQLYWPRADQLRAR